MIKQPNNKMGMRKGLTQQVFSLTPHTSLGELGAITDHCTTSIVFDGSFCQQMRILLSISGEIDHVILSSQNCFSQTSRLMT